MALATLSDLGVRLGLDLDDDARAQAILDDTEAAIVAYTGRSFTDEETTETLTVEAGKIRLTHGPVLAVDTITVDGVEVTFTWTSGRTVVLAEFDPFAWATPVSATVTYTHGYTTVPAAIVAVACQIAGRAYGSNAQHSGRTAEALGDYSESFGTAGASGPLGMLPDERRILDRFKAQPRSPITSTPWVHPR